MASYAFDDVEAALRASWSIETCDTTDAPAWEPSNPTRGQCVATAFLIHDLFGGEILEAEVDGADGSRQGFHYWNRLPDGREIDLTRAQFVAGESLGSPTIFVRPDGPPSHGRPQYQLLRKRVEALLAPDETSTPAHRRRLSNHPA